ncbi:hypothetical protein ACU4GD_40520 [Cupriavidus basilensis]
MALVYMVILVSNTSMLFLGFPAGRADAGRVRRHRRHHLGVLSRPHPRHGLWGVIQHRAVIGSLALPADSGMAGAPAVYRCRWPSPSSPAWAT